jgi:hypothetical protein
MDNGRINPVEELRFTQRLKLHLYQYKGHLRIIELANLLDKDKGKLVSSCYNKELQWDGGDALLVYET